MNTPLCFLAAAALLLAAGCDRAPDRVQAKAGVTVEAPASRPRNAMMAPPEPVLQETRAATRSATRPTSKDVPAGSRDPVVDGMKSLIREMILDGFKPEQKAEISRRIVAILEVAGLGEEPLRSVEADLLTSTLLDVQAQFRPKAGADQKRELTSDDEQRVRVAAEALATDLYRKLQAVAAVGGHAAGKHTAALRAVPEVPVPEGYEAVSWKTLGGFEYTEGMTLPEEVRKLHGAKVGIAGYMMTIEEVENIREFLLVESFWSCCFGTPPNVNQVLMIRIVGDRGVEYTSSPVLILGTLEVGEEIEDGFVTSVYRLKATSVTQAE